MPTDPLLQILADPPNQADDPPNQVDYDAVHAALMESERGRWFLKEYASRNRQADTQMLVGAIARVEAAIRGDPPLQSSSHPCPAETGGPDLTEFAAALERIAALIADAGDAAPRPGGSAAAERIADIAFILHERDIEASLCDALDAAVREITHACSRNQIEAERAQEAAVLLRELLARVKRTIVQADPNRGIEPPQMLAAAPVPIEAAPAPDVAESAADEGASNDGMLPAVQLAAELQEDEDFVQAVASLAASLPSLPDEIEPAADDAPPGAIDVIAEPRDDAQRRESASEAVVEAAQSGRVTAQVAPNNESVSAAFLGEPSLLVVAAEYSSSEKFVAGESQSSEFVSELASSAVAVSAPIPNAPLLSERPADAGLLDDHPPIESLSSKVLSVGEMSIEAPSHGESLSSGASASEDHRPPAEPATLMPPVFSDSLAQLHDDSEGDEADLTSRGTQRQSETVASERPPSDADGIEPSGEGGPSRALLPEAQPPVGSEAGLGDVREGMVGTPLSLPVEAMALIFSQRNEVASDSEHRESDVSQRGEPTAGAAEAEGAGEIPPSASAGQSRSPSVAQEAEPAALPALRSQQNDPLADVRALSEEETIALFS